MCEAYFSACDSYVSPRALLMRLDVASKLFSAQDVFELSENMNIVVSKARVAESMNISHSRRSILYGVAIPV